MRIVLQVIAGLVTLIGGVWVLQGLNILPGSFMTGDIKWAVIGAAAIISGVGLFVWARRKT